MTFSGKSMHVRATCFLSKEPNAVSEDYNPVLMPGGLSAHPWSYQRCTFSSGRTMLFTWNLTVPECSNERSDGSISNQEGHALTVGTLRAAMAANSNVFQP
jgi:hypothetical protein